MGGRFRLAGALAASSALLVLWTCSFGIDPDEERFSCGEDAECGSGFVCRPQKDGRSGACYREGTCGDEETCNGSDDDCNGVVDDDVPGPGANCTAIGALGRCAQGREACVEGSMTCVPGDAGSELCNDEDDDCDGQVDEAPEACGAGTTCRGSSCVESSCGDGVDNDSNGGADCADVACRGQGCSGATGFNCGQAPVTDGGSGTEPACVPVESDCADGADEDGDGAGDCLDDDCAGRGCDAGTCVVRVCS